MAKRINSVLEFGPLPKSYGCTAKIPVKLEIPGKNDFADVPKTVTEYIKVFDIINHLYHIQYQESAYERNHSNKVS